MNRCTWTEPIVIKVSMVSKLAALKMGLTWTFKCSLWSNATHPPFYLVHGQSNILLTYCYCSILVCLEALVCSPIHPQLSLGRPHLVTLIDMQPILAAVLLTCERYSWFKSNHNFTHQNKSYNALFLHDFVSNKKTIYLHII